MGMTVRTNNVPRDLIDASALTEAERKEFDYLDWAAIDAGTGSATFFRYRGDLYDLGNFTRLDNPPGWNGGHADTFFSTIMVRLVNDNEQVVVGMAYSCHHSTHGDVTAAKEAALAAARDQVHSVPSAHTCADECTPGTCEVQHDLEFGGPELRAAELP